MRHEFIRAAGKKLPTIDLGPTAVSGADDDFIGDLIAAQIASANRYTASEGRFKGEKGH